jgi:uncharacterized membrane protein
MEVAENVRLAVAYLIGVVKYTLFVGAVLVVVFNVWNLLRRKHNG